ncbi:MAG TPA: hypothetical protein VD962_10565 [Rubricoccaceae bacterium]|nr:hypothetical protein [Rubricoccaceae bacterium]
MPNRSAAVVPSLGESPARVGAAVDGRKAFSGVCIALGVLFLYDLGGTLALNRGTFTYSLDDPYIHLALAEGIAGGHYGINPAEPSAPSSSPLWPFLLAPSAWLPGGELVPLLLNVVAALAAAYVFTHLVHNLLPGVVPFTVSALVVAMALATNLVGLVFTGMEHALHAALSAAAAWGLIREQEEGRLARWVPAVLILGPLVRYEGLALTVPAVAYLFVRGHRAAAAGVALGVAAGLGAFALFLHGLGLSPLPTSIYAKSPVLAGGSRGTWVLDLLRRITSTDGMVVVGAALVFLEAAIFSRKHHWALAAWALAAAVLHVVAGQFGWFGRYEPYLIAVLLPVLLYLFREPLRRAVVGVPVGRVAVYALAAALVTSPLRVYATAATPLAARNIYEQQYQMHRFARAYDAPIAANDIGWVSFQNPHYVLDLAGLASREALMRRMAADPSPWMDTLAARHDVHFAMIYEEWFPERPARWVHLGTLRLGHIRLVTGGDAVAFFALDAEGATRAQAVLPAFVRSLPPGVRFAYGPGTARGNKKAPPPGR